MIFSIIITHTLLIITSIYGQTEEFCAGVFKDYGIHDAFNCSQVTNISGQPAKQVEELDIVDGSDRNFDIDIGKKFKLSCCFTSHPYCPTITWYKDGVLLTAENDLVAFLEDGRTLHAHGAPDSEGNYTCKATTPYGNSLSHTIEVNAKYICTGKVQVLQIPKEDTLQIKKGSRAVVEWNFICFGDLPAFVTVCKNGSNHVLVNQYGYYNITSVRSGGVANKVTVKTIVTISNFTRSENITCSIKESEKKTFFLQLAEEDTFRVHSTVYVKEPTASPSTVEPSFFHEKGIWIVIGGSLIMCIGAIIFVLWYRVKVKKKTLFFKPTKEKDVAARYDAFISYSEADGGSFVRTKLKPILEDECGYKLSLHYREFVPGTSIVDNIVNTMYDSRRIVTVITPKFIDSEWCKFEVHQGLRRAIDKPNTLVVIMLNEIPLKQLPKSLRSYLTRVNFLQWDEGKPDQMRRKLRSALGKPCTVDNADNQGSSGDDIEVGTEASTDRPKVQESKVNYETSPKDDIWSSQIVNHIV